MPNRDVKRSFIIRISKFFIPKSEEKRTSIYVINNLKFSAFGKTAKHN